MIYEKNIWPSGTIEPVRVKCGNEYLTENLKKRLEETLKSYHLRATVSIDEIQSNTIFNKRMRKCICVKNNDNTNYNFHIITSSKQGKYCIFKFYMGSSELKKYCAKSKCEEMLYYAMVDEAIKDGLL